MKVAVLGATGKEGQLLLAEAKRRGMDVTAIVRNASKITDGTPTIEKDVYQLTTEDIQAFDVLISALGFPDVQDFPKSTQHLIEILTNQKTRLFVVGGAGTLYVDRGPRTHNSIKRYTIIPSRNSAISFGDGRSFKLIERSSKHPLDLY